MQVPVTPAFSGRTYCAICGYRDGLRILIRLDCVCGGTHLTCSKCRYQWEIIGRLEACPETDEFRTAAAVMGRAP